MGTDGSERRELELRLERTLPVSQATVYEALTDSTKLATWWGPTGFTVPNAAFEPRVGSGYRISMQPPDGEAFHLEGEFQEVEPPARLAYTFRWDPPDPDDRETLVTISLIDRGPETDLRLVQSGFATEARYALHETGWMETLERLDQFLRRGEQA
jgi:uncharacterized protein YndB with AHSA1/START domain